MAKKIVDGVEEDVVVDKAPQEIQVVPHEFNREDLNEMRDRLNEVIGAVNNLLTQ